jgi:AcrR family transcriptional regulator
VRAAVLAATLDELSVTGYTALTVDNIARAAGVRKRIIYCRWQDRERVAVVALR